MFKVDLYQNDRYWNKFMFEFESLEEAQQFVQTAMSHFVEGEDDDVKNMTVCIEFRQKFTTEKDEEDESQSHIGD